MSNSNKLFDLFLSYKSEDGDWVARLKRSLEKRGVKVWLDQDRIRPGDRFAEALEHGIESSRAVALIVTPESVTSNWVKEEYYRALSFANQGTLQLIPVLLRHAKMPGFLADRHYVDLTDDSTWEMNIDRIVWPGITGKEVVFFTWCEEQRYHPTWPRFVQIAEDLGLNVANWDRLYRLRHVIDTDTFYPKNTTRLVLVFDIFDTGHNAPPEYYPPQYYVDQIRQIRAETKGTPHEIVFLLYQNSNAWQSPAAVQIDTEMSERLKHYFTIHHDCPSDEELKATLREMWYRIQQQLLQSERQI